MSVVIFNGVTVTSFVEDADAFNRRMEERFASLDVNGDGVLSRAELMRGLEQFASGVAADGDGGDLNAGIFEKFDADRSGTVDLEEFKAEMREMLLAVARGIGDSPIEMMLENESFFMMAVEHESAKRG